MYRQNVEDVPLDVRWTAWTEEIYEYYLARFAKIYQKSKHAPH